MNIYRPYEALADTEDCLHLKETETRERIHFVIYRVLPIFLLFFLWYFMQEAGAQIPMGWNYPGCGDRNYLCNTFSKIVCHRNKNHCR
jgi:hypothetical protein